MQVFYFVITLVVAASFAMIIQNWLLRKVSVNYIALILGMVIAISWKISLKKFVFEPEVFIGLIVAPLLFFEGLQNSLNKILRSWKSIFSITVIMIIIATIVAAFSIKLVTAISLPLAFVLAAISTPTDATAAESVSYGLRIPRKVNTYLKNESLFNDASGIILLDMAVTWAVSKQLELGRTFFTFIYSAGGGIIVGFIISAILVLIRQQLVRSNLKFASRNSNAITALIVIYVLTPIFIYYLAELIHVSGIIAVVVSGLIHNAELERSKLTNLSLIYSSRQITVTISELLNGIVFIILGLIIVRVLQDKLLPVKLNLALLIGLILYLANLLVRYGYSKFVLKLSHKNSWIFALGGIHGAVTFALAYTLDHTLIGSQNFHLILLSETSLIIFSMVIPTLLFRFSLVKDRSDLEKEREIEKVRKEMVNYALSQIQKIYLPKTIKKQLEFDLQAQINETSMKDFLRELRKSVKSPELTRQQSEFKDEVYRYAFRQERDYLEQLAQKEQEYRRGFRSLYREILLAEILFLHEDDDEGVD